MKPYYQDDSVTIYHGDCREFVDISAAVILTDPPYGNETDYGYYRDSKENLHDTIKTFMDWVDTFVHPKRMLITPGVGNLHSYPAPTWTLAWFTPAGAGSGKWGFCCWQPALVYGSDPYLQSGLGRRPDAIVRTETAEKNGHPCPKPFSLWEWMLERVSPCESEVILDPFMGSGTTLRAAKDLGRKAIGIEIEEKYCEIAARRMEQEVLPLNDASNLRTEVADTDSLFPKESSARSTPVYKAK